MVRGSAASPGRASAPADSSRAAFSPATCWCWGYNGEGEVGQPVGSGSHLTPTRVDTSITWLEVDSAEDHSCAVKSGQTLSGWGLNTAGDLGNTSAESDSPVAIPQKILTQVTTFDSTSCSWKTDDTMACWGNDSISQLGDGNPRAGWVRSPSWSSPNDVAPAALAGTFGR